MSARSRFKHQAGQVVLTLLVLLALGLTIGLVVVSRSTVDIELSSKLEREARVFSANEAFVEDVLVNPLYRGDPSRQRVINGINVAASALAAIGPGDPFVFPEAVANGETQTVWLVNHDITKTDYPLVETPAFTGQSIDVCWSRNPHSSTTDTPGMVISLLYKDIEDGQYKLVRGAYRDRPSSPPGSCGTTSQPTSEDCFEILSVDDGDSGGNCGQNLDYRKVVRFADDMGINQGKINTGRIILLALRLRPVYNSVTLAVRPSTAGGPGRTLPRQAISDAFVAAQDPETGESTKIRVFYSFPFAPAVFDYVLFSGQGLSHQ